MLRPRKNRCALLFILLVALTAFAQAQDITPPDSTETATVNDSTATPGDTATVIEESGAYTGGSLQPILYQGAEDTVLIHAYVPQEGEQQRGQKPTAALFKSMLVPGLGQLGNRKYIKAGLAIALESYLIYEAIYFGGKASDWRDKWQSVPDSLLSTKTAYFNKYTGYRDDRNTQYWFLALTVFISMFDAYVDAHLAGFPENIPKTKHIDVGVRNEDEVYLQARLSF